MMKEREHSDELSDEKIKGRFELQEMGIDFLGENSIDKIEKISGFDEKASLQPKRSGSSGFQELTLSYLCENSKLGFHDRVSSRYKGKEIVVSEDQIKEDKCIMRDFLQLNESRVNFPKRGAEYDEYVRDDKGKKPKVESLNLSLALPDVSLSLAGSNRVQNGDFPSFLKHSRSVQSFGPSFNNTMMTYSNDFTTASLSYTHSHPHSHNPSCSLTDYSLGSHRRDLNCGEGTNGSVHSRFRPVGDGSVSLSGFMMRSCNSSLNQNGSSENCSFFPSELPAKPGMDARSGDSRGRGLESSKDSERIARDIVTESIPVMAQIIQEITDETIESAKEYLRTIMNNPERRDELLNLQKRLERRSDLTRKSLSKSQKTQLEILVAIKMGLSSFLSSIKLPTEELVDIFLLERCRNMKCRRALPVEDCDCKICSTKRGFCSECMCPVCFNFDSASNTCCWVGCDVCSHWCHAICALRKNLIRPGPSLRGISGITEIQFNCLGCGHDSEMFGFVKDVFMACAKDWGLEIMGKELDCVRKIFQGSEDRIGKELHMMADELLKKLEKKRITSPEVCNFMLKFFNYTDGLSDLASSSMPSKDAKNQLSFGKDTATLPRSISLSSSKQKEITPIDIHQSDIKYTMNTSQIIEDEWSVKPVKKANFDSLENLVRIKEAEARMFQSRADEARREVKSYRRIVRMEIEKLGDEYSEKLTKLCLKETEERQRKKLEELKELENSEGDYYKMKLRMQTEISGLLKRMEVTKQQMV